MAITVHGSSPLMLQVERKNLKRRVRRGAEELCLLLSRRLYILCAESHPSRLCGTISTKKLRDEGGELRDAKGRRERGMGTGGTRGRACVPTQKGRRNWGGAVFSNSPKLLSNQNIHFPPIGLAYFYNDACPIPLTTGRPDGYIYPDRIGVARIPQREFYEVVPLNQFALCLRLYLIVISFHLEPHHHDSVSIGFAVARELILLIGLLD